MKRTPALSVLVGLLSLLPASEILAGGGNAGLTLAGKITGPAVNATIVIDPSGTTETNPFKGQTSIRVQKGTSAAGANFLHLQASLPPASLEDWVLGCDGQKGAFSPDPNFNVKTLTAIRFVNHPLTDWMPAAIKDTLLYDSVNGGLGLIFDPAHPVAGITDVDNPVCTTVVAGGIIRYILSFTAVIQFAQSAQ